MQGPSPVRSDALHPSSSATSASGRSERPASPGGRRATRVVGHTAAVDRDEVHVVVVARAGRTGRGSRSRAPRSRRRPVARRARSRPTCGRRRPTRRGRPARHARARSRSTARRTRGRTAGSTASCTSRGAVSGRATAVIATTPQPTARRSRTGPQAAAANATAAIMNRPRQGSHGTRSENDDDEDERCAREDGDHRRPPSADDVSGPRTPCPTTSSAAATGPYQERAASEPTWSCQEASARAMSSRPRRVQDLNQPWSAPRPSSMSASGSTIDRGRLRARRAPCRGRARGRSRRPVRARGPRSRRRRRG